MGRGSVERALRRALAQEWTADICTTNDESMCPGFESLNKSFTGAEPIWCFKVFVLNSGSLIPHYHGALRVHVGHVCLDEPAGAHRNELPRHSEACGGQLDEGL